MLQLKAPQKTGQSTYLREGVVSSLTAFRTDIGGKYDIDRRITEAALTHALSDSPRPGKLVSHRNSIIPRLRTDFDGDPRTARYTEESRGFVSELSKANNFRQDTRISVWVNMQLAIGKG